MSYYESYPEFKDLRRGNFVTLSAVGVVNLMPGFILGEIIHGKGNPWSFVDVACHVSTDNTNWPAGKICYIKAGYLRKLSVKKPRNKSVKNATL